MRQHIILLILGLILCARSNAQTVNYRSIGTNTGVLFSTGTVSATKNSPLLTLSNELPASPCIGQGDAITINGQGTYYILSASGISITLQSNYTGNDGIYSFTIARAYNSIQAWENGQGGDLVAGNRVEVGVCYNDGTFNEYVLIDGNTTDATHYMMLTVAPCARHNGTSATGATITNAGEVLEINDPQTVVEWLVFKGWGSGSSLKRAINLSKSNCIIRNCIFDGGPNPHTTAMGIYSQRDNNQVYNNIFLNLPGNVGGVAIRETDLADDCIYANNTIYNCRIGVEVYSTPTHNYGQFYNNISVGCTSADFTGSFGNSSHNLSSDASAPGTNSIINSSASLNFVSTSAGAEDLHLKSTAPARDNGTDLSSLLGFNYDTDMDTRSGTWDIGADEYMGPLPIDLVHFQAKERQGVVYLEWITASEMDNDYFEIERALEGEPFETIGRVHGAGTSSVERFYSFIDDQPLRGKIYYRLRQVDYNGTWSYSPVRVVTRKVPPSVSLFPNPTSGEVFLLNDLEESGAMSVTLLNAHGQLIESWSFSDAKPTQRLELPQLPAGVYWLRVVDDQGSISNLPMVIR